MIESRDLAKTSLNPEEIQRTPNDVMAQLIQQNSNLSTTVEDRAADLYDQMQRKLAHSGNRLWISPIRQRKVSVYRCTSSDCNQPLYRLKFAMTLNRPCRIFLRLLLASLIFVFQGFGQFELC